MSENTLNYWIKLKEDFADSDILRYIEELDNGAEYCWFYTKLCLKSCKSNGVLVRMFGDVIIPYDAKSIALLTNTKIDTVRVALEIFKKFKLVEVLENGELFITRINEMLGKETNKAELMRRKRELDKIRGNNVTQMLPKCSKNVTQSIECRDKILDTKEKSIENIEYNREHKAQTKDKTVKQSAKAPVVYFDDVELNEIFIDFLKMRKSMKIQNTDRAIKLLQKELDEMSDDKTEVIEQSIKNGWRGLFPIKKEFRKTSNDIDIEERDEKLDAWAREKGYL